MNTADNIAAMLSLLMGDPRRDIKHTLEIVVSRNSMRKVRLLESGGMYMWERALGADGIPKLCGVPLDVRKTDCADGVLVVLKHTPSADPYEADSTEVCAVLCYPDLV
jgi:hypothetical protein